MKWLAALFLFGGGVSARTVPWSFHADFHNGFNGWMSYPLPQDIGFDPTLSVEQAVLIREVVSVGQSHLSTGVIRTLHFLADSRTRIELGYVARWPSAGATLKLLLAGEDGRRYEAALPPSGVHEITVTGAQMQLPGLGVAIEAVVLMGSSPQPAVGSNNRFELRKFQLGAGRPAHVALVAPALLGDTDRKQIAGQVIDAGSLPIALGSGDSPVRIVLTDDSGRTAVDRTFLAPGHYVIPLGKEARPGLWAAHLQTADASREFSFLVLGRIPAHPRVLISPDRLAQLRSAPEFGALRKQMHERARTMKLQDAVKAGAEIAALPPGPTLRPSFDGELDNYFQLVESYSKAVAFEALDYALTDDSASLASARRDLLAVSRWPTWTPPRFAAHGMHTYYETGVVTQRLAFAYDLLAPRMPRAEQREIAEAFWTKCIAPTVDEYFRFNRMPTGASNWMSNSLGGALTAAIAVAGDVPNWRSREGQALAILLAAYQLNLHGLFPGDGSDMEPAGYEHFAMEGLSWGAAALRNLDIRPAGLDKMLQGFWWPDYAMLRPDIVLDTGDFNGELRSLRGFAFGAEFGGIPALRAFYDRVERRAPDLLDLLCCTHAAEPPDDVPPSRIFAVRGSAILRSGWDPNATVISLRAGRWFNHEHHDQGSFQVAAFGSKLISEAGYASYYLDPNYPGYFSQASGHNTVLVDGDAFSQGEYDGPFWKALDKHAAITESLLSGGIDYVATDLTPAYDVGVSAYARRYLFLKPDMLIVRDDLRSAQPHVFSWLLHAAEDAHIETHGARARITAGDAESVLTATGAASRWEVRAMPLPASISQILGNVVLHPGAGEQKIPHRDALCLSSSRTTNARFEVSMQFGRRSSADTSDTWALFRDAPGDLRSHGLASDASLFAGRGTGNWIAIGARTVHEGSGLLFQASNSANVAWESGEKGVSLELSLHTSTAIEVHSSSPVAGVSVDGAPVQYSEQNGRIQLSPLSQGEHRVWISTRTALP